MNTRILVVEDDPTLRMGLRDSLEAEGYDVTVAADGLKAEELLYGRHFALVLLDIMMPGKGGLEVLRGLRAEGVLTPVVLLTARSDENDKVLGLELGADDYVTKPFGLRELMARLRVILRREERSMARLMAEPEEITSFVIGEAEVDLAAFELRRAGRTMPLTPKEAAMLRLLQRERGKVVSRTRFLEEVWEGGDWVTNRTVDTHMLNLRKKIERDATRPVHLLTVHGAGYRLDG
ncbi:MAG: response regulator transcription factor [Planctomycetes bacterium]|nr:response regulator transcription factor [Planctomycetota bacterium]